MSAAALADPKTGTAMLEILLAQGAHVGLKDGMGYTAMHWAAAGSTVRRCTARHSMERNGIAHHNTPQHNTTRHSKA